MGSSTSELEAYLHRHIPLSREMEVRVEAAGAGEVRLSAPLARNINHRSTVFGGSASALAILSAWTLVHVRLRQAGLASRIVIQRSSMDYLHPIHGDFQARCAAPGESEWERFEQALRRRGRARIVLHAEVIGDGRVACTYQGAYVALRTAPATG